MSDTNVREPLAAVPQTHSELGALLGYPEAQVRVHSPMRQLFLSSELTRSIE